MDKPSHTRKLGYARVSTRDQNLDMQLCALKNVGCEQIFTDQSTGKLFNRKGLKLLLKNLRTGDCVVVYKLDRLGRNTLELLKLEDKLTKSGVVLKSLTQNLDTSTPSGKLTFTIFAALSEHESQINGERTKGGMAARRASGVKLGRPPKLTPAKIAKIQELYQTNTYSPKAIAGLYSVSTTTIYRALEKVI